MVRGSVIAVVLAFATAASASSVDELVKSGEAHENAGDPEIAARRYTDALTLDPTSEQAYLHLGALRAHQGDGREAVRVYSVALSHMPGFHQARRARAHAYWQAGAREDAERDLEDYLDKSPDDDASLRTLADWYGLHGRHAAQLATWRRLRARARDEGAQKEAATMVRALQIMVAPADPVLAPETSEPVRRSVARITRRGG
jgi:tetratricopeptide (TPR) repeat protein